VNGETACPGTGPGGPPASKADVAELLAAVGLEALPATVFRSGRRPVADDLTSIVAAPTGPGGLGIPGLMVRTSTAGEERNLPRAAGLDPAAAAAWIRDLAPELDVIVQPYVAVIYSAEIAVYDGVILAELVPGIWELDTAAVPATLRLPNRPFDQQPDMTLSRADGEGDPVVTWPTEPQPARFHDPARGYEDRLVLTQAWQVTEVANWLRAHRTQLAAVRLAYGGRPVGLKIHHAVGFGLSPQNVRSTLPAESSTAADHAGADGEDGQHDDGPLVLVRDAGAALPQGRIVLDVAIAREDHHVLSDLIDRLHEAGIGTVWLRSGLLSHLAITLREAGLEVRRADERLLRR
jgi:hypothetical protein